LSQTAALSIRSVVSQAENPLATGANLCDIKILAKTISTEV